MISYTDLVGTMMSSMTEIVNTISYVLVAFVAISLVVSSIMIGVITYISVLERKKRSASFAPLARPREYIPGVQRGSLHHRPVCGIDWHWNDPAAPDPL